jgi:hypothetical protein
VSGYWRASATSTDVRPCWFADACAGNNNDSVTNASIMAHTKPAITSSAVSDQQVDVAT